MEQLNSQLAHMAISGAKPETADEDTKMDESPQTSPSSSIVEPSNTRSPSELGSIELNYGTAETSPASNAGSYYDSSSVPRLNLTYLLYTPENYSSLLKMIHMCEELFEVKYCVSDKSAPGQFFVKWLPSPWDNLPDFTSRHVVELREFIEVVKESPEPYPSADDLLNDTADSRISYLANALQRFLYHEPGSMSHYEAWFHLEMAVYRIMHS
ncbi:hypothetical protein N7466_005554 [Penicillium verhagenii]|uniref:uncharacterized protein n=1 Tax=Penicillium verhagenii TaxID=1562060 RepID=UPI0025453D9D|nr:uncharacterized protein N7466_005554 [Penicillium verhagenii]KAJ5930061.1 hypothetical protein N7466_005554 [Penicillium verhagenii]